MPSKKTFTAKLLDAKKIYRKHRKDVFKEKNKQNILKAIKLTQQEISAFYKNKSNLSQYTPSDLFSHYNYLKYEVRGTYDTFLTVVKQFLVGLISGLFTFVLTKSGSQATLPKDNLEYPLIIWILTAILAIILFIVIYFSMLGFAIWFLYMVSKLGNDKNNTYENYILPYELNILEELLVQEYSVDLEQGCINSGISKKKTSSAHSHT